MHLERSGFVVMQRTPNGGGARARHRGIIAREFSAGAIEACREFMSGGSVHWCIVLWIRTIDEYWLRGSYSDAPLTQCLNWLRFHV